MCARTLHAESCSHPRPRVCRPWCILLSTEKVENQDCGPSWTSNRPGHLSRPFGPRSPCLEYVTSQVPDL